MPIYEYECRTCKMIHEFIHLSTQVDETICPKCFGTLDKLISKPSFTLKGSGWASDGYSNPKSSDNVGPGDTDFKE